MSQKEEKLFRLKKKLLTALRKEDADFGLHLVSNARMNILRRQLMARRDFVGAEARKIAHEKMVNVLSFPEPEGFPHPETGKHWLGEIYLNSAFGRREVDQLGALLTHGVLHLLGYRHDLLRDTIKMEALEKKICTDFNLRPLSE